MIILARNSFDYTNAGKTPDGKRIIRGRLKDGILAKLRCPLCGGRLTVFQYHKRCFHDLDTDETVIYLQPQVICHGEQCPHYDGKVRTKRVDEKGRTLPGNGAAHLLFPSFIVPYVHINSKYVTALAKAQRILDENGCSSRCGSKDFEKLEKHNRYLLHLQKVIGNLWSYLRDSLNTPSCRYYLAYYEMICSYVSSCFKDYVLRHFYAKHQGVINGYIRTTACSLNPLLHSTSSLLRVLLSEFVLSRPICDYWPPAHFFRKLHPYRFSEKQNENRERAGISKPSIKTNHPVIT